MAAIGYTISSLVAQSLGSRILEDAPLMEAGLDSLAASEVVKWISEDLAISLPATLLFDHPSLASTVRHVATLRAPRFDQAYDARAPMPALALPCESSMGVVREAHASKGV